MPIQNQFMHQNQIMDRLERPSETICMWWMVSEDLPTPSKVRFDAGSDGVGRSSETIHHVHIFSEYLSRPSKI